MFKISNWPKGIPPPNTPFSVHVIMEELVANKSTKSPIWDYSGFKSDTASELKDLNEATPV